MCWTVIRRRKKVAVFFACVACFVLAPLILPYWVHEAHFHVGAAIRSRADLNRILSVKWHSWMTWLDGARPPTTEAVDVKSFVEGVKEERWKQLREKALAVVDQLYPQSGHRVYHHGLKDAWAFWALLMVRCGTQSCRGLYDPLEWSLKNMLSWRGISGSSDDILWATLFSLANPGLLPISHGYSLMGARGAIQMYTNVEEHFVSTGPQTKGQKFLFWDTNQRYVATIGISLFTLASARLHIATGDARFLKNAVEGYAALRVPGGKQLLTDDGDVYDGITVADSVLQGVNPHQWTYNVGVVLGALVYLHQATGQMHYMDMADRVARRSLEVFWRPHLGEDSVLNNDQKNFKAIYLYFLRIYLSAVKGTPPKWISSELGLRLKAEAEWVVKHRLTATGFCVNWGEPGSKECLETSLQGAVTISQLFALLDLLNFHTSSTPSTISPSGT